MRVRRTGGTVAQRGGGDDARRVVRGIQNLRPQVRPDAANQVDV